MLLLCQSTAVIDYKYYVKYVIALCADIIRGVKLVIVSYGVSFLLSRLGFAVDYYCHYIYFSKNAKQYSPSTIFIFCILSDDEILLKL